MGPKVEERAAAQLCSHFQSYQRVLKLLTLVFPPRHSARQLPAFDLVYLALSLSIRAAGAYVTLTVTTRHTARLKAFPDLYDLSRSMHRIVRVPNRSDLIIPKKYISTLVCTIRSSSITLCLARGLFGLSKKNEELHAQLSADEKSVAGRTRKRVHEELQATQSPTKVVVSPPRPRPVKKLRRVTITQQLSQEEDVSEPDTEPSNTSATQQAAPSSGTSTIAAGKRRRRAAVPAPDSKLAEKHDELLVLFAENSLTLKRQSKLLDRGYTVRM
ncbi:hypothetical protein PInf_024121 [Phytophthora infestans]|nr:hypothetical protein PInf_024121 [Phytophthora infestans]